jgi:hypothetical protein
VQIDGDAIQAAPKLGWRCVFPRARSRERSSASGPALMPGRDCRGRGQRSPLCADCREPAPSDRTGAEPCRDALCSWRIRGLLDHAPRALPSCWHRHLPPTAFAWLRMSEGTSEGRPSRRWDRDRFKRETQKRTGARRARVTRRPTGPGASAGMRGLGDREDRTVSRPAGPSSPCSRLPRSGPCAGS